MELIVLHAGSSVNSPSTLSHVSVKDGIYHFQYFDALNEDGSTSSNPNWIKKVINCLVLASKEAFHFVMVG